MEKNSSLAWAIAKVIREEREKKGLTQGQLAGLSGLSETYISFIEHAHTKLSVNALVQIAAVFSLDASEAIIEVDHEMSDVRDEIMDAQNSHRKKETLVKDILNNIQNLYKVANQREVTKIQDEFYKVYVLDDMLQLKHFARQLDIISEGYRAQSL